ncbi:hypothetical protein TI05_12345 [Achromatium sp. WMS3]|nr:hypothetical protein TI05_12345 [Achromatium sp. WMS3]
MGTLYLYSKVLYTNRSHVEDQNAVDIQKEIFKRLDGIVQSSAVVECVNSIIRSYLNVYKNNISQKLLNFIIFYYNHRRYADGAKGKMSMSMELFTGKGQSKDWIYLLFDIIREKDQTY